ncbi:MAG: hypothetical protein AB4050_12390 [Synechococcus sp.]
MLSFTPPYQIVGGYTLLPDSEAEQVRYVLPSTPQLRLKDNGPVDFSLVQYLGGGAGNEKIEGGLLTFSAELVTEFEALQARLDDDFELKPVLFDEGTVELVALGSSSIERSEDAPFELQILGSGKPALDIKNRVSFQLLLDAAGAELVEKLLETPELPLVLIYRMQLSGLRPSYNITIEADWQKVYSELTHRLKANAYYVAADVEVAIEKALETQDIAIDTTVFGSSEADRAAAEAARKQLLDWVIERMFEPLFATEPDAAETVTDAVDNVLFSLVRTIVPGVSYRLRSLTQEQIRHFEIRMDEAVAERREVVPQGTLGGLFRQFQVDEQGRPNPNWTLVRQSLVKKINLNGFPRLEVEIGVEDRFSSDGVARVETELRQPNQQAARTFTFRSATERQTYIVNLLGAENPFDLPYEYRTIVHFDPAHSFGAHEAVQTAWKTSRTPQLIVETRLAYKVESIQVFLPPTFQFRKFAAVVVDLGYEDWTKRLTFRDTNPQTWHFRHFETTRPAYKYTVTYLRPEDVDAPDIALLTRESTEEILSLPNPAPDKRVLQILVNLSLEGLHVALLELRYEDEANGITFDEQIDLVNSQPFIQKKYDIADGGSQEISYRLTVFGNQGLLEGEWRTTEDTRLVVDTDLLEKRLVTVRPIGGTLEENRLQAVRVHLEQRSLDGTVRAERQMVWEGELSPQKWEFGLGDPPIKELHIQVMFVDQNGFVNRLPWQTSIASNLIVHLQRQELIA